MGVQGRMYTGMSHSISGRRGQGCKRITAAAAVLLPLCAGVLLTGPPSARLPVVAWLVTQARLLLFFWSAPQGPAIVCGILCPTAFNATMRLMTAAPETLLGLWLMKECNPCLQLLRSSCTRVEHSRLASCYAVVVVSIEADSSSRGSPRTMSWQPQPLLQCCCYASCSLCYHVIGCGHEVVTV